MWHGECEIVPIKECRENAMKISAEAKWVDVSKGAKENPEHRCRLVAKEIKKKREDWFAATAPLEAKKVLFAAWAGIPGPSLDFADVVHVYLHARARRRVFVELSQEDYDEGKRGPLGGLLTKATYGATDAAQGWELGCTEMTTQAVSRRETI